MSYVFSSIEAVHVKLNFFPKMTINKKSFGLNIFFFDIANLAMRHKMNI